MKGKRKIGLYDGPKIIELFEHACSFANSLEVASKTQSFSLITFLLT